MAPKQRKSLSFSTVIFFKRILVICWFAGSKHNAFAQVIYTGKLRWDLFRRTEKLKKFFKIIKQLEEGYIPQPNDRNALASVVEKIPHLLH